MKIMGIDPGCGTTALVLNENGRGSMPMRAVEIKVDKGNGTGIERSEVIAQRVVEYAEEWEPDAFMIEGYAYARSNGMVANVECGTMIRHMIRMWFWSRFKVPTNVPGEFTCISTRLRVATPNQVKQIATGKGQCPKDQVILGIYKRWGFECPTEHIADAYALSQLGAIMYHDQIVGEEEWEGPTPTQYQLRVAAKVKATTPGG